MTLFLEAVATTELFSVSTTPTSCLRAQDQKGPVTEKHPDSCASCAAADERQYNQSTHDPRKQDQSGLANHPDGGSLRESRHVEPRSSAEGASSPRDAASPAPHVGGTGVCAVVDVYG